MILLFLIHAFHQRAAGLIKKAFNPALFTHEPAELYDPITYTLNLGGKRIRPLLVLLGCDLFGGNIEKAMPAAIAIELFHNFTFSMIDIMDCAPLRRGQETVYKKWNTNICDPLRRYHVRCGL